MSVRRATLADIPDLIELFEDLHMEAPAARDEPFEPDVLAVFLANHISQGTLLADDCAVFMAFVGDRLAGALIGLVCSRWFNRLRFACEMTLYVRPEHRGGRSLPRLVQAYKEWAKAQGAFKAYLGVSTGIHPERTVRAYEHLGAKLDGYNLTITL